MSKPLLIGYYGYRNTGDDAFLAVSAREAGRLLGESRVMANTAERMRICEYPIDPLYGRRWFPGYNRIRSSLLLRRCGHVIFGGGSLFHARGNMEVWTRWLDLAGPGPHIAAGVSVGPFRDAAAESACAELISKLAFVGVRDSASYQRVLALKTGTQTDLTFDLAPLLLDMPGAPLPSDAGEQRGLGIAMCNYERFTGGDRSVESRRITRVAAAVRSAADRGLLDEVVLLDFNGHPFYGDRGVHEELADLIGASCAVRHLPYSPSPLEALRTVSRLRGVLAMRLHAAVFAYITGIPALVLAYHEKCHEWADAAGVPRPLLFDSDSSEEGLTEGIGLLLSPYCPRASLPLSEAMERARRNWPGLDP